MTEPHFCREIGCRNGKFIYGPIGTILGIRCEEHKLGTDVDCRQRVCRENQECREYPIYSPDASYPVGVRCHVHAKENDVCVVERRVCETCHKRPTYGKPNNKPSRCKGCSKPGDVRLKSKLCEHEGCLKSASFGKPSSDSTVSSGEAKWCSKHANKDEHVHVMSQMCMFKGCKHNAYYGAEKKGSPPRLGTNPMFCKEHCPVGYVHTTMPSCVECDQVIRIAYYSLNGKKPGVWCGDHKPPNSKQIFPEYIRKTSTKKHLPMTSDLPSS